MRKIFIPSEADYQEHLDKYGDKADYFDLPELTTWCTKVSPFRTKRVIETLLGQRKGNAKVLDLGCGIGLNTPSIAYSFPKTVACEIEPKLAEATKEFLQKFNLKAPVVVYDGKRLPFKDNTFDIVCCVEVFEHAENPNRLLAEISRVLKPDGFCYLTAPNKYWPMEGHYRLPFLSYFPRKWADTYIRLLKKGRGYRGIYLMPSYNVFYKMANKYFEIEDITFDTVINYKKYGVAGERGQWVIPLSYFLRIINKSEVMKRIMSKLSVGWLFVVRPKKRRPKIVVLTLDHLYSNKINKAIINHFKSSVSLVADSGVLLYRKSLLAAIYKYLKVSGAYYVFARSGRLLIYKILSRILPWLCLAEANSRYYFFKYLAKKYRIPVIKVKDMNGDSFISRVEKINPDIIVSVFCNQIFGKRLISVAKRAIINIHPAYLPDYKGVSPVFWAMANDEKYVGVTVHLVDSGVDTGRIVRRRKIPIGKSSTEDSIYWRTAVIGSRVLIDSIEKIFAGTYRTYPNVDGRYFSLPTKEAVSRLRREGKRIYRLKDMFTKRDV